MEIERGAQWLRHLLERIVTDPGSSKNHLPGFLSTYEIEALNLAIRMLESGHEERSGATDSRSESEKKVPVLPPIIKDFPLDLSSLEVDAPPEEFVLCLDFGTAMSKAFATRCNDGELSENLRLPIGSRVTKSNLLYAVPSSLWISDDGAISFGEDAILKSLQSEGRNRQRFDSPKKELTQGLVTTTLDEIPLSAEINPSCTRLSKGDAITLYLAYLTDLACSELEEKYHVPRHITRRFALPSWDKERRAWGESMMGSMLAKAQILADTFHGQWQETIPIIDARNALDTVNRLVKLPMHLIGAGVAEPLAAASSRLRREKAARGLVMVLDVGAGTSDFGMFVVAENPQKGIYRAWPISSCSSSLHQAGDYLDIALEECILQSAHVDATHRDYSHIVASLRLRIRSLKEELFRDQQCAYTLSNAERGIIELHYFLEIPAVRKFGDHLAEEFQKVLDCAHNSFYERFDGDKLSVVLSGGGASLPMVQALGNGFCGKGGYRLRRAVAPLVPEEFSDDPELSYVYPQLSVAIGGAQPDMINESSSIAEMPGLASGDWQLGRFQ